MKFTGLLSAIILLAFTSFTQKNKTDNPVTLAIGSKAPDFKLPGTDGNTYSLASFAKAKILVVVFTCNHCPTAQAYEDRIIQLTTDYKNKGVQVVAIMPNDPTSVRLDELGYSDLNDSYTEMKLRHKQKKFNFPYLYDGKTQSTAKAYGPVATPHVFIFDDKRMLRFQGRIDDVENPLKAPRIADTRAALDEIIAGKEVTNKTTKVFGCSIKWASKSNWIKEYEKKWAAETVELDSTDEAGLKDILKNNTNKLRLINVWATWCGPCVTEFPDFITINRMYGDRDFEFISISADNPAQSGKALQFLKKSQASNKNYIFNSDDKYKLIDAIDPKWQGALPYTILVEPAGKIVYAKQGRIDAAVLKKLIVEHPLIGRFYKN
jgi:peroxiredoxin